MVLFLVSVLTSVLVMLAVLGLIFFSAQAIRANEYSPLDFASENDGFAVTVGHDRGLGRYFTYHYRYSD